MKIFKNTEARDKFAKQLVIPSALLFNLALLLLFFKVVTQASLTDTIVIPILILSLVFFRTIYAFQAWTKDVDGYFEWLISTKILYWPLKPKQPPFPKSFYYWMARVISPLIVTMMLCIAGLLYIFLR